MSGFAKFIIGFISTLIILIISYFVFKGDRVFDIVLPKDSGGAAVRGGVIAVRDKIYGQIDALTVPIKNKVSGAIDGVFDTAKNEVDEVFTKATQGAANSIKKSFNEKIDAISGQSDPIADVGARPRSAGLATSPSFGLVAAPPATVNTSDNFPLGFSVQKGLPAIFVVKSANDDKIGFSYSVAWGDGKIDTGVVAPGGATTIYHIWEKAGEYNLKIETKALEVARNYSSYILVY